MTVYHAFADELEKIAFGTGSSALLGTALGAGVGALADKENRARGAFIGGGVGAGAGLGTYYGVRALRRGGRLSKQLADSKDLAAQTTKIHKSNEDRIRKLKSIAEEVKKGPRIDLNEDQKKQIRDSIKSKFSDEELAAVQELARKHGL